MSRSFPTSCLASNKGGIIWNKLSYTLGHSSINLFVCLNKNIEDLGVYQETMNFEDFIDMLRGDAGAKKYAGEECEKLANTLAQKCSQFTVSSDLSYYQLNIDHNLGEIKFDPKRITETPNYEYLHYPNYQITIEYYDYIDKSGFYYFFLSNCYKEKGLIKIFYKVQNPGNEHLPLDLIPNKITYLVFFVIWIGVFLVSLL